jgi:adenylate cyclase
MPPSIPSLRVVSRRAALVAVVCNLAAGALIFYVYGLGLLQPEPGGGGFHTPFTGRFVPTMALWAAIVLAGALLTRRIDVTIERWYELIASGTPASDLPPRVQRYVVDRAAIHGVTNLAFWLLAGLVMGVLFVGSIRVALVIAGVAGVLSVALALPLVDLAWRPIVPAFFPDGQLSTVPAWRLSVFSRLFLSMLLVGLYPTGLLAASSLSRAAALVDAPEPQQVLNSLIGLDVVLVGISVLAAVVMALSMTRSIIGPLSELRGAMDRVAQSDLAARATVTTNDELGYVAERFNDMVAALRRGEVVRGLLDQYVSPAVAQHAVESGAELGGRLVHCTVLFADIRDFTGLSERLPPDQLVLLLNRFMGAMVGVVAAHGGLVHKFGGDSLLAVFGTPLNACEDHAASAVRAALGMRRALEGVSAGEAEEGRGILRVGVGIATGPVVAGNIGGKERIEYTVIGAAVNLAARLQTMTREVEADILLHSDTYAAASQTMRIEARPLPPLSIRGLSDTVTAFAL